MKKTFLALAVLGAFADMAAAQTSIQIYGIVDAGIRYNDNDGEINNDTWRLDSGMQSGSRLGFRGTEDLGGGVSAIFTLESGFNIDDGTMGQSITPSATTPGLDRLFGRQAFVGVSSGLGTVKLGRQYTPIRVAVESIDPFGLGLAGNAANVINVHGERTDNTLNYTSPSFGGFSGQIAYTFGEQSSSFPAGRHAGASLGYANGPINVVLAYHDQNLLTGGTVTAFPTTPNGDERTALVGGTFDFGVAKLHAAYSVSKREDAVADNFDRDDAMIGVSAPIGAGTVLASYIHRKDDVTEDSDAGQFALGYLHNLSKRTNLYTSFAYTKNDPGARLNNPASAGGALGADPKTFNVGVRHRF